MMGKTVTWASPKWRRARLLTQMQKSMSLRRRPAMQITEFLHSAQQEILS